VSQQSSKLDFKRGARTMREVRDAGNDVARQQAQDEPIRVM
jgi:hypothetical protein